MTENDDRTYIKLHDGMPDHPKVDGLSDKAFRLLVETWCWCSRHLTDGYVPQSTWQKRGTKNTRRELVEAGLVIVRATGGVECHDYLSHQRSAHQVAELREKKKLAAAKGNHERWHVGPKGKPSKSCPYCPRDEDVPTEEPPPDLHEESGQAEMFDPTSVAGAIANGSHVASQVTSQNAPHRSPETEEVLRTSQTETDPLPTGGGAGEPAPADAAAPAETQKPKHGKAGDDDPMFAAFWSVYPRKVAKDNARKKFAAVVAKGADASAIVTAAETQAKQWHRERKELQFVPHAATWLNQRRFEDEPEQPNLRLVSGGESPWPVHDYPQNPFARDMGWAR